MKLLRIPVSSTLMILALLLICFTQGVLSAAPLEEDVLLEFKRSVSDPYSRLSSWVAETDCSRWSGLTCDSDGRVTSLSLGRYELSGSIPSTIGKLSHLQTMYLEFNKLSGSIPSSIGNLSNLQVLFLSNNELSGSIPSSIGNLSNLYGLSLVNNKLSGPIPSSIWNLFKLKFLDLSYNELSGSIPSSIENLSDLSELSLGINKMSGSIPSSIGNLSKLNRLDLTSNQFTGPIPSSLENLHQLQSLYLGNNSLTGVIPCSLMNFNKPNSAIYGYKFLSLSDNKFIGYFPFFDLSGLLWNISNNYFIGSDPAKYQVDYARSVLSSNCFTGVVDQKDDSECSRFCGATSTSLPCNGYGVCHIETQKFDSNAVCSSTRSKSDCVGEGSQAPSPTLEPKGLSLSWPEVSTLSPTPTPVSKPDIDSTPRPQPPASLISSSPCGQSMFNPCGSGSCVAKPAGKFSCVCPNGYGKSQRSAGRSVCILKKGNRSVKPMCNVWYTVVQTDTCESISKLFGLQNVANLLNLNPKLSCSNLVPFQSICVSQNRQYERNFICKKYNLVGKAKSCLELVPPGAKLLKLFESNPGLYCNNLQNYPQKYCISTILLSELGCKRSFTVKTTDKCDYLIVRYFNGSAKRFSSANKGLKCDDDFLYNGLQLCL